MPECRRLGRLGRGGNETRSSLRQEAQDQSVDVLDDSKRCCAGGGRSGREGEGLEVGDG